MEYTVNALSRLAGVSKRTLRYYDEIGLLHPKRKSSNGYRIYGEEEVEKLQQILFYRHLDMPLEEILRIMDDPEFDTQKALENHRQQLAAKKAQLDLLLETIDKTLASKRGETKMTDEEKFEGFKQEAIEKNEKQYGKEIREKYGRDTIEKSNQKLAGLRQEDYQLMQELAEQILTALKKAMQTNDPTNEESLQLAHLHKEWLSYSWPTYSKEAHRGLAQMYVDDPRFMAYYDEQAGIGAAEFLRKAIFHYTQ
ncbi:MAG: MerR family transcriptional regulator [Desemzia incerta]|uniref:MerR family transcriptional regulator n=1 Tax=Desemzia incerta TaxID=82801 RepID=UPI00331560AA